MKTFKFPFLLFYFLLVFACTQEPAITDQTTTTEEIQSWKPADGIQKYLPQDFLSNFTTEEISFTERLMRNEKTLELRRNEIRIAAGTTNKLAEAIASANRGDVIVLESGDHFETGTVLVNKCVTIEGYGANLVFSNTKGFAQAISVWDFNPGLHINKDGAYTTIRGITFKGTDTIPGAALAFINTEGVKILQNQFDNWQESIFGYNSSHCVIWKNKVNANPGWTTGAIPESDGIILSDGSHNQIIENEVKNALFGIFTGGSLGIDFSNTTTAGVAGQILCKVPAGLFAIQGIIVNTTFSTNKWRCMFNNSSDNFNWGYLVIDGANNNFLDHNKASNNGLYDIELTGDSFRFGFLTPKAFENRVHAYGSLKVKDCGEKNTVVGGTLVDNTVDPCF